MTEMPWTLLRSAETWTRKRASARWSVSTLRTVSFALVPLVSLPISRMFTGRPRSWSTGGAAGFGFGFGAGVVFLGAADVDVTGGGTADEAAGVLLLPCGQKLQATNSGTRSPIATRNASSLGCTRRCASLMG